MKYSLPLTVAGMLLVCPAFGGTVASTITVSTSAAPYYIGIGTDPYVFKFVCAATANTNHQSASKSYTIKLGFSYTGSATDTPPSTVSVNLHDDLTGSWSYMVPGWTPPDPSVKSQGGYSVTSSLSGDTVQGNYGPIYQGTTDKSLSQSPAPDSKVDKDNVSVSTPLSAWTATTQSDGVTIVYTFNYKTYTVSGNASASAPGADGFGGWTNTLKAYSANGN